ncbi:MAG: hypothetical protein ACLR0U_07140 [Enterocloster clostridioformis]
MEQTEDKQDKEVLMGVYDLLDFKRTPTTCSDKSGIALTGRVSSGWAC